MVRLRHIAFALAMLFVGWVLAEIIPAIRRMPWAAGVTVGAQGERPVRSTFVYITNSPYYLDRTGYTDSTESMRWVITNAAAQNAVAFLNTGTYVISNFLSAGMFGDILPGNFELRGEGIGPNPTNSRIILQGGSSFNFAWGPGRENYTTNTVIAGFTNGSPMIVVSSPTNRFGVANAAGQLWELTSVPNINDTNFPVLSVVGYDRQIWNRTVCISNVVDGTNWWLMSPLEFDYTNTPTVAEIGSTHQNLVINSIWMSVSNPVTGIAGTVDNMMNFSRSRNFWITNSTFSHLHRRFIAFTHCHSFDVRGNIFEKTMEGAAGEVPNRAGILLTWSSSYLIDGNVFKDWLFSAIQIYQGASVGAITANFFTNCFADIQFHAGHVGQILIERNVMKRLLKGDGYFTSTSRVTVDNNEIGILSIKRLNWEWNLTRNRIQTRELDGLPNAGNFDQGFPLPEGGSILATNPPYTFHFPGPFIYAFDGAITSNGFSTVVGDHTDATNIIGDFHHIRKDPSSVYSVRFSLPPPGDTNTYLTFNSVLPVSDGTTTNLHVNKPITVPNGARIWWSGPGAYQQWQPFQTNSYIDHANAYAGGEPMLDPDVTGDFPATWMTDTNIPTDWVDENGGALPWPFRPTETLIPAQRRLHAVMVAQYGGGSPGTPAKTGQGRNKGKGPRGRFFQP